MEDKYHGPMKCHNFSSFTQSLNSEKVPLCLVISSDEFELLEAKRVFLEKMHSLFPSELLVQTFDSEDAKDVLKLTQTLLEPSLFQLSAKILIISRLSLQAQKLVDEYIRNKDNNTIVFAMGSSVDKKGAFYKSCVECGIVAEFGESKPWEKEDAAAQSIVSFFKENKKSISSDLARYLAKELGTNRILLAKELEKLSVYLGSSEQVTKEAIDAICCIEPEGSLWKMYDAILVNNAKGALEQLSELLQFDVHPIAIVRFLNTSMHQGLQMTTLMDANVPVEKIREHFPRMKPKMFDKNMGAFMRVGSKKLKQILLAISQAEIDLKSSSPKTSVLMELLILNLCSK